MLHGILKRVAPLIILLLLLLFVGSIGSSIWEWDTIERLFFRRDKETSRNWAIEVIKRL